MGASVSRDDFEWTNEEQSHTSRRKEILEKHPEIRGLFGHDPWFKWQVSSLVLLQFVLIWAIRDQSWSVIFLVAYTVGGVFSHSLSIACHEIGHNITFGYKHVWANHWFGFFANLPLGFPFAQSFYIYHVDHHRHLGTETYDTDVPTYLEAKLFSTTFGKLCFIALQPITYLLRPIINNPKRPHRLELINAAIQIAFDCLVYYLLGWKSLVYMFLAIALPSGPHILSVHKISEHYMFNKGFETYSYYGCLNYIMFNVGYHNEHHDFPFISGRRLPEVRRLAPEFYDTLPYHTSLVKVLWDFVTDPAIGPYARMLRKKGFRQKDQ